MPQFKKPRDINSFNQPNMDIAKWIPELYISILVALNGHDHTWRINLPCLEPPPRLSFLYGEIWDQSVSNHLDKYSKLIYRCAPKIVLDSCLAPQLQQVRSLY